MEWKAFLVLAIVAPIVPLVFAEVGDVSFLACKCCVCHRTMQAEGAFGRKVIDTCSASNTVIPEGNGAV